MQAMIGLGIKEDAGAFLDWMLHATAADLAETKNYV